MNNFLGKCLILACILLLCSWSKPIRGQAVRTYEPFQATPEYTAAANHLAVAAEQDLGIQQMLALGQSNSGTTLGATSLFTAAYFSPADKARAIYQQISQVYPQSHFDVVARLSLLNISQLTPQQRFAGMDALVATFGGPTLKEIRTRHTWSVRKAQGLTQELKDGLMGVYALMHRNLSAAQGNYQEALPLAIFAYETFGNDPEVDGALAGDIQHDIFRLHGSPPGGWAGTPYVNPTIRVKSPDDRITGPRPRISIEVWTGDYRQLPVYLSQSKFLVDGQDVRSLLLVQSKFAKKAKIGRIYERDTWTYRPASPLSPGLHTVSIVAQEGNWKGQGPGVTSMNFTFRVRSDKHDDDDHDDDGWDCWTHDDDDDDR